MYKLFSQLFIMTFFLFPGLSFGEGKKFTINGKIPEMPSGRMIVITQLVDRVDTLGQGDIREGKFVVEGEMKNPCVALIYVEGYGGGFVFILDSDAPYEMELFQSGKSVIKGGKLQSDVNSIPRNWLPKKTKRLRLPEQSWRRRVRQSITARQVNCRKNWSK